MVIVLFTEDEEHIGLLGLLGYYCDLNNPLVKSLDLDLTWLNKSSPSNRADVL